MTTPVTSTTAVQQAFANSARDPASQPSAGAETAQDSAIGSDFDTFLTMLTVQMQNQDPLNPTDSSDYAVQLATFSGVEQQVRTNDLLSAMVGGSLGGLAEIAGWVGRQARVTAPVTVGPSGVTVLAEPVPFADRAVLNVRGETGEIVASEALSPAGGEILWTAPAGAALPPGPLSFEVESFAAGVSLGSEPAAVYADIREVRMERDGPGVVLPGGSILPTDAVTALRAPPP